MSSVSVLTVDDFEAWRCLVRSTLKKNSRFQIIGEISDGLEAVQKAEELKPDLIVLDIGLPKMNGIEAAQQIRKLSPKSKILFLSENHSPEVAKAALAMGASGYVVKSVARRELLTAAEAVIQGERFVSARLACHDFTDNVRLRDSVASTHS
jgi:DNA-binding NarL/FixJ family response regulator